MAGRGVDIILGGRPESVEEHDRVVGLDGLHIIGTERHEARRIDNQLRGRGGRQGDPGSSQFFVSLEDDLMRVFGPGADRMKRMMSVLNVPEDQPIESGFASRAIESAQGKIEGYNFDIRKHVLEYDDVMNKQRQRIYLWRRGVLAGETEKPLKEQILEAVEKEIVGLAQANTLGDLAEWNFKEIYEVANSIFPLPGDARQKLSEFKEREEIINYLVEAAKNAYEMKEKEVGQENMRQIERLIMLRTIDVFWMDHLDNMEHLRDSVRLRAYGQRDPLVEYKNEGHRLFQTLLAAIESSVAKTIYKVTLAKEPRQENPMARAFENRPPAGAPMSQSPNKNIGRPYPATGGTGARPAPNAKIGRNDPCWCGSGKKFKKCHGA